MNEPRKDPRHVYANPENPEICCILALDIYWLNFGFDSSTKSLFPGQNQYERFRKAFGSMLTNNEAIKVELRRRGLINDVFGTHPIRRSSFTYSEKEHAICLGAGWKMP